MEREEHARGRGFRSQESPTCPFSPPCSHLYRSGPPRTRARNYTSRQDASARTRTGASAMATVLSRALKLPGKKPQPRDHLAPAGPGEVGRGGSGGEADRVLAPTRKEVRDRGGEAVQPPGAGVHASPGAHGALGGSGVTSAGRAWERQRKGLWRRAGMVAPHCGGGECQSAHRRRCPQGRAVRLASFFERREGCVIGSPAPSTLGGTWARAGGGMMASDPLEQPLHLMTA